jgi:hypothetical protein
MAAKKKQSVMPIDPPEIPPATPGTPTRATAEHEDVESVLQVSAVPESRHSCGVEPPVLTGGLFLGRCWQDGH